MRRILPQDSEGAKNFLRAMLVEAERRGMGDSTIATRLRDAIEHWPDDEESSPEETDDAIPDCVTR